MFVTTCVYRHVYRYVYTDSTDRCMGISPGFFWGANKQGGAIVLFSFRTAPVVLAAPHVPSAVLSACAPACACVHACVRALQIRMSRTTGHVQRLVPTKGFQPRCNKVFNRYVMTPTGATACVTAWMLDSCNPPLQTTIHDDACFGCSSTMLQLQPPCVHACVRGLYAWHRVEYLALEIVTDVNDTGLVKPPLL